MAAGLTTRLDAVVLTAVREEYEEAQAVEDGAEGPWVENGPLLRVRTYETRGGPIAVGLALALDMRGVSAANAAHPLVAKYEPQCLAMSGVCAGRRGKVQLGDVVIGDPLYTYDAGALVVDRDEDGQERHVFRADPNSYRLTSEWRAAALAFAPPVSLLSIQQPPTIEEQCDWLLGLLEQGEDPRERAERVVACPQWKEAIVSLRARELLEPTGLTITSRGRVSVAERELLHPDGRVARKVEIHLGAIATGQNVVRDPTIFERLSYSMRSVVALDMEASAVGAVAHDYGLPFIVMKAAMDHGDGTKSDGFKRFSARVSAECVMSFLRQNVVPRPATTRSVAATAKVIAHTRDGLKVPTSVELHTTAGEEVSRALSRASNDHRSVLLVGRGGSGKTTALRRFVGQSAEHGRVAVLLSANAFLDDIEAWCRSGLPSGVTFESLESEAEAADRTWCVIVDGLNECSASRSKSLSATLQQLMIRHRRVRLVCSTRASGLDGWSVGELLELALPNPTERAEVLRLYNAEADATQVEESALLLTPLDLAQAAVVWKTLPVSRRTRFGLRAAFVQHKLQHDEQASVHALLRSFAAELYRTTSLSMSTPQFLRWLEKYQTLHELGDALSLLPSTGLLEESGGVSGFSHESLLDHFMAEQLLRTTSDAEEIAAELRKPRYASVAPLVLEAQIDPSTALTLLSLTGSTRRNLPDVARGGSGRMLQEVVEGSLVGALQRLASDLVVNVDSEPFVASQTVPEIDADLLDCAVALATEDQRYFLLVLDALARADGELERQSQAISEAHNKPLRGVRSRVYAASYWMVSRTRLGLLVRSSSRWRQRRSQTSAPWAWASHESSTPGQAMFLAEFLRFVPLHDVAGDACERLLLGLFDCAWSLGWSDLRRTVLDLFYTSGRSLSPGTQKALLSRLSDLPDQGVFLNSSLFEAMEALGEKLDTTGVAQLTATIAAILEEPTSTEMRAMAYGIFSQQFEPLEALSEPAGEAIAQLSHGARFRFHSLAALGASASAFHGDFAIESLGSCSEAPFEEDRQLLHEALFRSATPWTGEFAAMPLDPVQAAANFLRAHERLAKCGHWKRVEAAGQDAEAWAAIADLVVGLVRDDRTQVAHAWNRLHGELLLHSWEAIGWVAGAILSGMHASVANLIDAYPDQMSALVVQLVSRRADWKIESPVRENFAQMALERFVDVLGRTGGPAARATLLELVDVPELGLRVREAIREIDRRS